MGPSTNTLVIFLAFIMNNGHTEDDFYDFHHSCCHFAVIIMGNEATNLPGGVSFKNVLLRYLGSRMVDCACDYQQRL